MKNDDMLLALESAAQKKGVRVSYENFAGEVGGGGLCKVKGEWRLMVDRRANPSERISMVAGALCAFPLDDLFLAPEIRDLIERVRKVQGRAAPTPG